ncbi:docking protein 5-like [Ylistrum balloti]|uniref:docking protein 5-like n=1 Tax=Ylistrum balloti TaxID=509963 RepID=UPI002905F3A4|nr:docking protein 5-like [Ylistrum balloti]XP_060074981.1 docking protein 5-like [Ylistrum balloti]XP_060074982.1 docking protein 5-like [Ylistrum balloti]
MQMADSQETSSSGVNSTTVIKQGYVEMKSKKMFGSKKRRWLALFKASSKGPTRLIKYESEWKARRDEPLSITNLIEINTIVRMGDGAFGIVLQMNDHTSKQFMCKTDEEAKEWLHLLQSLHISARRRDSMPGGIFRTYLMPSSTLNFQGECVMEISTTRVTLFENERKASKIVVWPINHIRRYGYDKKNQRLFVEAGSRCDTGEGIYLFTSIEGQLINDYLHKQAVAYGQNT